MPLIKYGYLIIVYKSVYLIKAKPVHWHKHCPRNNVNEYIAPFQRSTCERPGEERTIKAENN